VLSLTLSQTAEYALRAMSCLALSHEGEPVRAQELSERTRVPLPYLWKVMRRLVAADLVLSAKGHGGGFRLARPPGKISYLDILRVTGYDSRTKSCVFGWGRCRDDHPCPMHASWTEMNGAFAAWASGTTLASLGRGVPARS
jgi:Rrf2 family iron-sulfur cluster assembly transcriptional regulator